MYKDDSEDHGWMVWPIIAYQPDGSTYEEGSVLPFEFVADMYVLSPEFVSYHHHKLGTEFWIWAGRRIGEGVGVEWLPPNEDHLQPDFESLANIVNGAERAWIEAQKKAMKQVDDSMWSLDH